MATAAQVRCAIASAFPVGQRAAVESTLKQYRGNEQSRVRLAILVLADGDPREVIHLVKAANEDYRDLLYWAEYPEESGNGTRRQMAARYRALGVPVPEDLR